MPPQRSAISVARGAMTRTVRAPAMVRANTSRPRSSAPNQCAALGACRTAATSTSVGLCVKDVEKSPMKTQMRTMMRPTMKVGLRSSAFTR